MGANPYIYHLFDPFGVHQISADGTTLALYEEYQKTFNSRLFPNPPRRSVGFGAGTIKLTDKQYEEFAQLVGKKRKLLVDAFYEKTDFDMPSDKLADILSDIYSEAYEAAKTEFKRRYPSIPSKSSGGGGFSGKPKIKKPKVKLPKF